MQHHAYFGAVLYLNLSVSAVERERLVRRGLIDWGGRAAGVPLACFETMHPGTDRFRRVRKTGTAALEEVLQRWRSGEADSVLAYDHRMQVSAPSEEDLFTVGVDAIDPRICHASVVGPRRLYNGAEVKAYLQRIAADLPVDYGCLCAGDRSYVQQLISFVPTTSLEDFLSDDRNGAARRLEEELLFYQLHRYELAARLPRAHWGNVVSATHTDALGGEERIRRESGCFLVERWGENLYLQVTPSPWDVTREQLLALNRFLEPVRFPGAPEPVYLEADR